MKKVNLSISVEQEKLNATRFYATKKDANIEDELVEFFGKLYEKYVPAPTREYIESVDAMADAQPKAAPSVRIASEKKLGARCEVNETNPTGARNHSAI